SATGKKTAVASIFDVLAQFRTAPNRLPPLPDRAHCMAAQQRPLSPHLQVYRPQITTVMSIMHRATGVLLAIGAFALMAWLLACAGDGESFACFQSVAGSPIGKIAL